MAAADATEVGMSKEEYRSLLEQVKGLGEDEACEELLDAARYGDFDVCRAILETFPILQQTAKDDQESTALHKACANGHVKTVKLLLEHGSLHESNKAGNRPLHWAAANGHAEIVLLLLSHFDDIDVLEKNQTGRSALTEGFGSSSTETAKALLEHDSATEERLLMGAKPLDDDNDAQSDQQVVHEFALRDGDDTTVLQIRELPIALTNDDDVFGKEAHEDTTGLGIWCASLVMARWMADLGAVGDVFTNQRVVELGAGCGIPGLAVARYASPEQVIMTDLNPDTLANLQHNIDLNELGNVATSSTIDWDKESSWPDAESVNIVIGSDLIYQRSIVPLLKKVVHGLLKHGGVFYYVAPDTGRDGLDEFLLDVQSEGMVLESKTVAPKKYHANPLKSQDEEESFLHFHELSSTTYMLYKFVKNNCHS